MLVVAFFLQWIFFIVGRQVVGGSICLQYLEQKQTNMWLIYLHIET